jgi:hypothetical protein
MVIDNNNMQKKERSCARGGLRLHLHGQQRLQKMSVREISSMKNQTLVSPFMWPAPFALQMRMPKV